tara:strand:- start:1767 stop:2429 length:663 start_codon:yes stop_codon:yes gene_type:complete
MYNNLKWSDYFADKTNMRTNMRTGEVAWDIEDRWEVERDIDSAIKKRDKADVWLNTDGENKLDGKRFDSIAKRFQALSSKFEQNLLTDHYSLQNFSTVSAEFERLTNKIETMDVVIADLKIILKDFFDCEYIEVEKRIAKAKFVDANAPSPKIKKMSKKEIQLAREQLLVDEDFLRMGRIFKWSDKIRDQKIQERIDLMIEQDREIMNADAGGTQAEVSV